jgi:crotonobetainyl-CoA:carnitine CoA-transferase CaiB-like acyl-CoA transferase
MSLPLPLPLPLPLSGIRILAVEQYGAGPFASMHLADLGAEVIKIESPGGGDVSRATGPHFLGPDDSQFFQTFNRNKKSVVLDLKSDAGRAQFHALVATADAVLNNLRGDQPAKLGLTHEALRMHNPRIVCAHLSAYGRDNERAAWPGYDYLMQAEAGYMHLTGEPDGPPARMGLSIVDYITGVTLAVGLLAALIGAMKTGRGRDVDVSLFDVALFQLTYPATWALNAGDITQRQPRSAHPATVPCQLFASQDGHVFLMCMTQKFWLALVDDINDPALRDARFADVALRRANKAELIALLDAAFASRTTAQWMAALAGKLPIAPVLGLQAALANPYLQTVGMVQALPHVQDAHFKLLANPIKLDGQRLPGRGCSALGADGATLLVPPTH